MTTMTSETKVSMPGYVEYKGVLLHKGSDAFWLYENGMFKELSIHMAKLDKGIFNPIVRKKK